MVVYERRGIPAWRGGVHDNARYRVLMGKRLTRRQAIVLRRLYDDICAAGAREIGVRSDVLWRLEERGLVTRTWGPCRSPDAQWRIRLAGRIALGEYTAFRAAEL